MKVSIAIIAKNESRYIGDCLKALLGGTYQEFEIVVIDNGSTDGTKDVVASLKDARIRYFYEPTICGISRLRNLSIKKTTGKYIFFTDADCIPCRHWIEEALRVLETGECAGINGRTHYDTDQKITILDYNTRQSAEGEFMTCNIAYSRDALERAGYFDPAFMYGHEDRDMAFRIMKLAKICFSKDMIVSHQRKTLTVKGLFNRAKRIGDKVYHIKKHGKDDEVYKNILCPQNLVIVLCPPLLILTESYTSLRDLLLALVKYASLVYQRFIIWKAAIKYRIFII